MPRLEELFSTNTVLTYLKERQATPMLGDVLFPDKKIEDLSFEMIKGASNLPVAASVHAFDTETEIASRDGLGKSLAELALIKRKIKMDEKNIIILNSPRNSIEEKQAIDTVFNDVDNMVNAVRARIEAMRMEAIATGKIVVKENGVDVTIDYGVPADHKTELTGTNLWSDASAKPLDAIYNWTDKVVGDTGFTPTRALTSKSVLSLLLKNTSIRKAVFGTNSDRVVTLDMLNQLLASMDLPTVASYDAQYRAQNANGTYTSKRYFEDGKFVLIPEGKRC
ncbi:major capsid protein [Clostridium thermarum]|uniref:major capsid protein n=1 Tax=Clostridium thermarum TaxID=1716543 RepID=UPI0013D0AF91|nr:major capsid protein [Clostridium thermarum]